MRPLQYRLPAASFLNLSEGCVGGYVRAKLLLFAMARRALLALLLGAATQVSADALITVPINKDGERYALLDFYQQDTEYIIKTARQFCVDHGFGDDDLRAIVEHTLSEMAKHKHGPHAQPAPAAAAQPTPAAAAQPAPAATTVPGLPEPASQLLGFMKAHGLNAPTVMKSLALLLEQGHTT